MQRAVTRVGIAMLVVCVGIGLMICLAAAPTHTRVRAAARALHSDAHALFAQALQDSNPLLFFQHAIEARCYARALRVLVDSDAGARAAVGADVRAVGERIDRIVRVATLALHKAAPAVFAEITGGDAERRARIDRALAPPGTLTTPITA